MPRITTIDYRRVTFSFPSDLLDSLRVKIGIGGMSSYVAGLIKKDLSIKERLENDTKEFIESLKQLAIENTACIKDKRSTLEILREIRYGGKY